MRTLSKTVIAIFISLLVACSTINDTPPEPPIVVTHPPLTSGVKSLSDIALNSRCSATFWKDRGRAPEAYIEGMVTMYARQVCNGSKVVASEIISDSSKDVAAWYNLRPGQLTTYTILLGLGMRESSGKYCEGRDATASWTDAHSAEAGLFQAAYVSRVFNEEIPKIYSKYKNGEASCLLEVFSEGVSCKAWDAKNWGSGEGVNYQALAKSCPAMAVEWTAVLIRSQLRHFGPLKRREAEYVKECEVMFQKVEDLVKANRGICSQL